ncbi:preprotein translocase subunit SecG [Candidatus Erwinia haradaeae]|uniref:Protein-export membrane protein SecG n=1 Tax=Candidatus Erwinia haradaeae TaxID=1922217 RepID=A0A451D349_9GAMM|nr:preprotein translocase subunit SecG [Candidatus Erwinia haradaeae]VFP80073.1 Protein-export membrane protein SecG [Candidatus Erwinia haradaeae]
MYTIILACFLIVSVSLISLILLQQGRGSIIGLSGSGTSSTLFGSHGANNFVTLRIIPFLAVLFFLLSLIIGNFNSHQTFKENARENKIHTVDFSPVKSHSHS